MTRSTHATPEYFLYLLTSRYHHPSEWARFLAFEEATFFIALAAANQMSRVGQDERGSILSTSYRQIDWIGDRNIQDALSSSNFDLSAFVQGNMDIFVIFAS